MSTRAAAAKRAKVPGPILFVLFGATGDLCKKMVLPSFFELHRQGLLPDNWLLLGNGRGTGADFDFAAHVKESLVATQTAHNPRSWKSFAQRLRFAEGDFSTDEPGSLRATLDDARTSLGPDTQLVHYLAIPPLAFASCTDDLAKYGYADGARVVYEKPFGTSMKGFRTLNRTVHRALREHQIFRIDHFLGKQATQQLHVLRFANGMFDAMWHRDHVRAVQIDVPEQLGVSDRVAFYEVTGAVLDMLVTHLFQVAAEVAMEPPESLSATHLQACREKVIGRFRPMDPEEVVLGQFTGYRELDGVNRRSTTETYVAAKLWIDTPRWSGVPFLLRTGKRLAANEQKVSLILREPAGPLSKIPKTGNVLTFSLRGDGDIEVSLVAQKPGPVLTLEDTSTVIPLDGMRGADPLPPYSRLLHDVLIGDRSLFTRPDGIAGAWKALTPLLENMPRPRRYAQGSWGPSAARKLAAPDGWLVGQ